MIAIDNLAACEASAERSLDPKTWFYLQRGAGEGVSMTDSLAAWRALLIA